MRRKLLVLCAVTVLCVALVSFCACSDQGTYYDFDDGTYGYAYNADGENTVSLVILKDTSVVNAVIPATVAHDGKAYTVTQIGDAAFAPSESGVTIQEAFKYDESMDDANNTLKTVAFAGGSQVKVIGNRAFARCKALTSIVLPETVTTIKGFAFFKCSSLSKFTIPAAVTTIGDYCFENCKLLTTVNVGLTDTSAIPTIGESAFKYYDASKAGFMGSSDPYIIIDNLKINFKTAEVKSAFEALSTSTTRNLRLWCDYSGNFAVVA